MPRPASRFLLLQVIPASSSVIPTSFSVIPAKAGIQKCLDPRFRGDDRNSGDDKDIGDGKIRQLPVYLPLVMVEVRPFRGIFYDPQKVRNLSLVVAPPYDVISPKQAKEYRKIHPYNVIRLILGKNDPTQGQEIYQKAAAFWKEWQKKRVLETDSCPGIYFLEQRFQVSGRPVCRRGMIALVGVEDFSSKGILPHENTLLGPKKDRLQLLTACRANFDPLFFLYPDQRGDIRRLTGRIWQKRPLIKVKDRQGITHRLWRLDDQAVLDRIGRVLKKRKMIIADGHHRYETALNYRQIARNFSPNSKLAEGANYVLSYLIDLEEKGLKILPIHRLVNPGPEWPAKKLIARLGQHFTVTEIKVPTGLKKSQPLWYYLEKKLLQAGRTGSAFALNCGPKFYLLKLKNNKILADYLGKKKLLPTDTLDVNVLQALIIDRLLGIAPASAGEQNLTYANDGTSALEAVRSGKYKLAFLLNPVRIEQVRRITAAGLRLPQKSTFFYPKILSGMVMRSLED